MKILSTSVYLGPNHYALFRGIKLTLDLVELEAWPTARLGEGFVNKLLERLPGLREHGCSYGEPGGFVRRLGEDEVGRGDRRVGVEAGPGAARVRGGGGQGGRGGEAGVDVEPEGIVGGREVGAGGGGDGEGEEGEEAGGAAPIHGRVRQTWRLRR